MKILALNFNQKGVGTYRRSFYFSRELARAGHDVTLVTVSRSSKFGRKISFKRDWIGELSDPCGTGPWIRLIEGPAWGYTLLPGWGSGPLDIWARVRELESGGYDAVFGFEYHPNVSWPVYFTQRRKQYAFFSDWCDWFGGSSNHFRGWKIAHRLDSYLEEKIRYRAKRLSVTSKLLFDRALSIGISANDVIHIPEGAATDYIMPRDRYDARRKICLPSDTPILLAVRSGDMCREVRIFREVLRQVPDALLVVLGSSSVRAEELAERLGVSDRITWAGWVSDEHYPVYLACADVCFCPLEDNLNDRARWPAKILDFLAAGRSTVTNAVGEVARSFCGRDVAVLVGQGDEEFGSAIAAVLRESDQRSYLGGRARQVMESEWDWRLRGPQIAAMVDGAG